MSDIDDPDWPEGYGRAPEPPANLDANDVALLHDGAISKALSRAESALPPFAPIEAYDDELARQEDLTDEEKAGLLPLVDMSRWIGEPPPRRSLWGDWMPLHQTTMLTGQGGVGKSLFEQVLLTHIALGLPFLGMQTVQRTGLYATCEDDSDELWRRQDAICRALGVSIGDVIGKLHLCSLTGENDTALATFDASGRIIPTRRWREIERTCEDFDVGVYAFDNATDAMAGDHNDLHQVAEFVNMLTGLAIRRDGVAMIVHHPNKAGEDWLGSVGWHNKVRSRMIIRDGDKENDSDARVIENPKANYGPSGGRIPFRWYRGTFIREEDLPSDYAAEMNATIRFTTENARFLDCLRARVEQGEGRGVGPSFGPNYAPAQFEGMPQAKGLKRDRLKQAMNRLFETGEIETYEHKVPGKGRSVTLIRECSNTPEPSPRTPPADTSRAPPNSTPQHPPAHTLYPTDNMGAPNGAAAPNEDEGNSL